MGVCVCVCVYMFVGVGEQGEERLTLESVCLINHGHSLYMMTDELAAQFIPNLVMAGSDLREIIFATFLRCPRHFSEVGSNFHPHEIWRMLCCQTLASQASYITVSSCYRNWKVFVVTVSRLA